MSFDAFLEQAWSDHGDRPEEVAHRLEQGYALIESPSQIAPFARILAHVDGEHLAHWTDGVARLERLRAHAHWRDEGDGALVVRRLVAALRLGRRRSRRARSRSRGSRACARGCRIRRCRAASHVRRDPALSRRSRPLRRQGCRTAIPRSARWRSRPTISRRHSRKRTRAAPTKRRRCWTRPVRAANTGRVPAAGSKSSARSTCSRNAIWRPAMRRARLFTREECIAICERNEADAFERFFGQGVIAQAYRALRRCARLRGGKGGRARALRHAARRSEEVVRDDAGASCLSRARPSPTP